MTERQKKLKSLGYTKHDLFAINGDSTIAAFRKLIKPFGLRLIVKYPLYSEDGDASWVKIEKIDLDESHEE